VRLPVADSGRLKVALSGRLNGPVLSWETERILNLDSDRDDVDDWGLCRGRRGVMFAVSMVTVMSPSSKSSSSGMVVCRDLGRPKVSRRPEAEGVRGGAGGWWFES
jgi:hypothetical protein